MSEKVTVRFCRLAEFVACEIEPTLAAFDVPPAGREALELALRVDGLVIEAPGTRPLTTAETMAATLHVAAEKGWTHATAAKAFTAAAAEYQRRREADDARQSRH